MPIRNQKSIKNQESTIKNDTVQPASRDAWRAWLAANHAASSGVWLVVAKKHTGIPSLTYDDAVEEALCFGWIDAVRHPVDERFYKQWFCPRKPKSLWSKPNKERVKRLVAQGLMTPAGQAQIDLAKRTGTWEALDHMDALTAPPELQKAFKANPQARKNWDALTPNFQKRFLFWLSAGKREETRASRLKQLVAKMEQGVRPTASQPSSAPAGSRARRRR